MAPQERRCVSCGTTDDTTPTRLADGSRYELCRRCTQQWNLIWRLFCACQPQQANRVRAVANRRRRARTDGGCQDTHLGEEGLFIPPALRAFSGQVVFRTPRSTIQHFGSQSLAAYYPLIDQSHFGEPATFSDPNNPELAPNRVRIKRQGEAAVELAVDVDPDCRCDGGISEGGPRQDSEQEHIEEAGDD
ncbi:hypothetical protein [Haloarcula amylolytica]|uniref:hypothetical protein n=1 Tax=Haloarcula amylolytica TaxID=396317 RepID=UPI003C7304B8